MLKHLLSSFALLSLVWLAANRGNAQQPAKSASTAQKSASKASDEEVIDQYQALVAKLPPERQAWERLLQENLGDFYLPIHQREKVRGVSNAWDYVEDDPKLPRVLLIGDSISRGYTQACRKALAGKANVHRAPANCGPTTLGLKKIDVWLGAGKWDLIHFNFGIHDFNNSSTADAYSQRLERLVERMKQTKAKLVFASSTPSPARADRKPDAATIAELNTAAAEIMKKHDVAIDDLYTAITPHLAETQLKDGHFKNTGYDILGQHVAAFIEQSLR